MENAAQQALSIMRNRMTGDDMRQLPDAELAKLEAICLHWQAMAKAERMARVNNVFAGG